MDRLSEAIVQIAKTDKYVGPQIRRIVDAVRSADRMLGQGRPQDAQAYVQTALAILELTFGETGELP